MREIYFHEDDYCHIELVAEANGHWCAEQMRQIDAWASAHKAGVGWTTMYLRSENPTPLASVGISRAQFTQVMPATMSPFDRVWTGYSSCRTECRRTIACGPNKALVAYAEFDDNDVVASAWFTFDLTSPDDAVLATDLAIALARWPLMIADWGWSRLIPLSDISALAGYFQARIGVFNRTHE